MSFNKKDWHLDFCEVCFQMTNHIGDVCQKCVENAKKENETNIDDYDDEDNYTNYR